METESHQDHLAAGGRELEDDAVDASRDGEHLIAGDVEHVLEVVPHVVHVPQVVVLEVVVDERGDEEKIWGSMIKQTLKRRKPGFSESHYGFRSFGQLLEEAGAHGILDLERDEKSGGFIIKGSQAP